MRLDSLSLLNLRQHQDQLPLVRVSCQLTIAVDDSVTLLTAADFVELNPPAGLTFTSIQRRICVNIAIIDDDITEPLESFTVTLTSPDFQVNILIRNALVFIADNDGKITISCQYNFDAGYYNDCFA